MTPPLAQNIGIATVTSTAALMATHLPQGGYASVDKNAIPIISKNPYSKIVYSHVRMKTTEEQSGGTMDTSITTKDYVDARQNSYERSIDERIARIEKSNDDFKKEMAEYVKDIKKDNNTTRWTIGALIVGSLGVVLTIQSNMLSIFNFGKSAKEDISAEVTKQNDGLGTHINGLDNRMNNLDTRMDNLENRMDNLENRMDGLNTRMDGLENKIDKLIDVTSKIAPQAQNTQSK